MIELTQALVDEIKAYYRDEALKKTSAQHRRQELDFLDTFDVCLAMRQPHFSHKKCLKLNHDYQNEIVKVRRAEGKIERYFAMKEKGRL